MPILRKHANEIFKHVLNTLDSEPLVKQKVSVNDSQLVVDQKEYNLNDYDHIYVIGGGKASAPMAKTIVITAGRPSGIAATRAAIEVNRISFSSKSRKK